MAEDHSFDIVCKVNLQELDNAINQADKEISNRYDLKDSKSEITFKQKEFELYCESADDFKLKAVVDILKQKMINRGISPKVLQEKEAEAASGTRMRQVITLQQGIDKEKGKDIVKFIKNLGSKLQAQIQEDQIRVSGKKIDDLQSAMRAVKGHDFGIFMDFINFR